MKKATATVDKAIVNTNNDERMRALQNALSMVEKNFGKGSVMQMGTSGREPMEASPTGALSLDVALGIGGIPKGRIIEIYGPESGGKTTLALHCVAEAQRRGEIALYIDAEHALDPEYARVLGVDVDNLYIAQPSSGEEALTIADTIIQSGAVGIVVVDSVAALVPRAEVEGEVGDSFVGLQARMMSQAMRKLGSTLNKSNTAAIFINQIREKIGVMYGNPETTPGGRALKFWASVRMEVRKGDAIKNGTDQIGARTKVKVVKNKVAPPFKTCEFDIIFGKGISKAGDLLDVATDKGVVSRSGTFYNYGETRLGQGRDNARTFLDSNPAVMDEIDQKVRAIFAAERSQAEPYVPEADTEEEPIA